ncbi:thioesterase family protein [Limnochorda pilosa]|uniref:thioesterase family protein n=1 Tax=Limnochorda pilosa TaxID=1555112 RepID=UPI0018E091E4|nr:thioesterase family protein [Limnochorda pilosa]
MSEADTAAAAGSGLVAGLATPTLLAWMEQVAFEVTRPHLPRGHTTVGTRVNLEHLAGTPTGMRVRVRAELVAVDGRRLRFRAEAWDEVELVGRAEHERFIVDEERFARGLERKRAATTTS